MQVNDQKLRWQVVVEFEQSETVTSAELYGLLARRSVSIPSSGAIATPGIPQLFASETFDASRIIV